MKKFIISILAFTCVFMLTGCGQAPGPGAEGLTEPPENTAQQEQPNPPPSASPMPDTTELAVPEGLPAAFASAEDINGNGGYLLIGKIPEADLALYCDNSEERSRAYIRYGEHFQAFDQEAWIDPTILPRLYWEDQDEDGSMDLTVDYLRHEGLFYDGTSWSPGVVYERVIYLWDGEQWTDIHFYSSGAGGEASYSQIS